MGQERADVSRIGPGKRECRRGKVSTGQEKSGERNTKKVKQTAAKVRRCMGRAGQDQHWQTAWSRTGLVGQGAPEGNNIINCQEYIG